MEVKIIDGKQVRRLKSWPNYGVTQCGIPYRWDTERKMALQLHGGRADGTDRYIAFRGSHNGIPSHIYLHKAIAECWLENDDPTCKTQVNHINGDKRDYRIDNLEWVTPSQNQQHALTTDLKQKGEDLYNAQLIDDEVHLACQWLMDGVMVIDVARRLNVSKDIISKLKSGDTYFHIRCLYDIPITRSDDLSESTVRWVCERILEGFSDKKIAELSRNDNVKVIGIKRIRNKTRYTSISNEYF